MNLADRIVALDFGRKMTEAPPTGSRPALPLSPSTSARRNKWSVFTRSPGGTCTERSEYSGTSGNLIGLFDGLADA